MSSTRRVVVASVFVDGLGPVMNNPFTVHNDHSELIDDHGEILDWFIDRNCAIRVDEHIDQRRFGRVYTLIVEGVTSELYLEYQLTWK